MTVLTAMPGRSDDNWSRVPHDIYDPVAYPSQEVTAHVKGVRMDRKPDAARGTAVYGSKGSSDADVARILQISVDQLKAWSNDDGLTLDESPDSLVVLDARLDAWNADASHHGNVDLPNNVGIYLGIVIIKHVEGARWNVEPDGHPVVQLRSGTTLDVTQMTGDRVNHSGLALDAIYSKAQTS
jgi:hypothetical protein